jgi:uncharacterized protein YunC (DUF1805 family)
LDMVFGQMDGVRRHAHRGLLISILLFGLAHGATINVPMDYHSISASESGNCINNSNNNASSSTIIIADNGSQSSQDGEMYHDIVSYKGGKADGYVIPLGPANLVLVVGERGMIGCGAFDVAALDRFGYPAAKMKPARGPSIGDLEDLLAGEVKEANAAAVALGIEVGMSGKEALDHL